VTISGHLIEEQRPPAEKHPCNSPNHTHVIPLAGPEAVGLL
jgi:hypothetical protein